MKPLLGWEAGDRHELYNLLTIQPGGQGLSLNINGPRYFSSGPVVKNPPSNAVDFGPTPGSGTKITYALEQLSPHTATKTQCSQNKKKSKIKDVWGPPDLMGQGF